MILNSLTALTWAFQLHYYLAFRTRSRKRIFTNSEEHLLTAMRAICDEHDYHVLRARAYPDHFRCLLSLQPKQSISNVIRILKGNSARRFGSGVWERGYLARSVGRVRVSAVKHYIEAQARHHGYESRIRPPVFSYRAEPAVQLTAAHAEFELNHHLVFATLGRKGVFDSALGRSLGEYWLNVARRREFAIDRMTIVPDHAHLLVRIPPKMSIEECALLLLNNSQHFVGQHAPARLIEEGMNSLWQASAYAGTCGSVTTSLMKKFLE